MLMGALQLSCRGKNDAAGEGMATIFCGWFLKCFKKVGKSRDFMLTFARQSCLHRIAVCCLVRLYAAATKNIDKPIKIFSGI